MNKKGQSYLVISFILVTIMITVAFVSRTPPDPRTQGHFLSENIEIEMAQAYTAGVYQDDVNTIITETSNEFREFSGSKGFELKQVFAAKDQLGRIWYQLGNWWGEDCTYYNSRRDPVPIPDGTTRFITRDWLLNDFNLVVCGHTLNLTEDFDYRVELHREGELIVLEG